MNRLILPLFVGLLFYMPAFAQKHTYNFNSDKKLSQYVIDYWSKENGLPSNSVLEICQTNDGYIWISSYNGLIRFDGINFKEFNHQNTPEFNESGIGALAKDSEGRLWMTTQSNGLISYYDNKFEIHSKDKNTKHLHAVIYIDKKDRIWAASPKSGWFVYDHSKITFLKHSEPLENIELAAIEQDKHNEDIFWFATAGKGVFKYQNGKFTVFNKKDGLISNWVNTVVTDKTNKLWIGTDKGISLLDGDVITHFSAFDNITVNKIFFDNYQNMWVATRKGLFLKRYNSEIFIQLNTLNGLSNNYITSLLIDSENSLWMTHYRGGVSRIKDAKFNFYTQFDGMSGTMVNTVCEIAKDTILVGFDNGTINKITQFKLISAFHTKKKLKGERIRNIFKDSKQNIWISTYSGLLKVFPNGKEQWFSNTNGFPGKYIRLVFEDSKQKIWVGTRNTGIIRINNDNTYTIFNKSNGLSVDLVMSIDEDKKGRLLVGTSRGGLNIIEDNQVVDTITKEDGLSEDIVFNTYVDKENNIWIAASAGLNCLSENELISFPVHEKGISDTPFDIIEDKSGNFWLPCSKGVIFLDKKELTRVKYDSLRVPDCILYNKHDGLKQPECTATTQSIQTQNSIICIPTLGGLATINPNKIPYNTLSPPVFIQSLTLDKEKVELRDHIQISSDKKRFIFQYTALSLYEPEKILFKYRLIGFENEWSEPVKDRSVSYTNLPYGNYTFEVIACNNDGLWNKNGKKISFYIAPHIYETKTFYFVLTLLLISGVFGIYKLRINRLKWQKDKLESTVNERTLEIMLKNKELSIQKEEIQAQSEEILTSAEVLEKQNIKLEIQNKHITDSVKYALSIQQAALPFTERIKQYLDIFIIYRPKDIVSGDFYWFTHWTDGDIEKTLFATVDCTGHGVPGAFMSMIGMQLLDKIVNEDKVLEPNIMLERMNEGVVKALKQKETDNSDGMDVALFSLEIISDTKRKISFSGAKRPLVYYSEDNLSVVKGTRKSIGGDKYSNTKAVFDQSELFLNKGDMLYLFTDGYTDQNDLNRKKFGSTRLLRTIESIAATSTSDQKVFLEDTLNKFQGNEEQRDDITLIGIRI